MVEKQLWVAIYIRDGLKYKIREDLSFFQEGEFELIFAEIISGDRDKSVVVGEIYRVPNLDENISLERYEAVLSILQKLKKSIILGTDQNFGYLKLQTHSATASLLDTFISYGLAPCITRPTRVTYNTATLIDNLYISADYCNDCSAGINICDMSDHFPVFTCVGNTNNSVNDAPLSFKYRKFGEPVYNQLRGMLAEVNWDFIETLEINDAYQKFLSAINSVACWQK